MIFELILTPDLSRSVARIAGVLSSSGKPVSAKQNLSLPRTRGITILCQLLGSALFLVPPVLRADALGDAAHELAMKVCAAGRKQPVRVHWLGSPESSGNLSDANKKLFLVQLSACGIEETDSPDAAAMNVAVRMTPSNVLLIAEAPDAAGVQQIELIEIPRASLEVPRETSPGPQLRRELLWQQEKPIQSAVEWQDQDTEERYLFFLSETQLLRSRFENGSWKIMDATELPAGDHRSRIEDGRFVYTLSKGKLALIFHDKICEFNPVGSVSLSCSTRVYDEKLARISSSCDESLLLLRTGKGDYTELDRITLGEPIQPYREAIVSPNDGYSSSVEMPGPVLDLSVGENPKAAFAVVKNLSTGNYEVYRITAVCSN